MNQIRGFLTILGLIIFNQFLFIVLFHISYFDWYIENGSVISLVTALISLSWGDINKFTNLIASDPVTYIDACRQITGLPLVVVGLQILHNREPVERGKLDDWIGLAWVILFYVMLLGWQFVVTPIQYIFFLICGAPARLLIRSSKRTIIKFKAKDTPQKEIDDDDESPINLKEINITEKIPNGWFDASLSTKPVTLTSLITSLLLLVLRSLGS